MAITTIANLRIDKLKEDGFVPFVTLELEQFIADHARVKIKIDLESFGENIFSNPMERIALINERFQIDVQVIKENGITTDVYGFLGLITDVQVELDAGQHGWMYISGASRSIELERGKFLKTHSDMKLKDIVDRVTKNKVYVMVANDPEYDSKIPFSMQYYETDYQYLKRLAWLYGEKFFFNGNNIVFGKIAREKITRVTYNSDLTEVKLNSRLISNRFKQYYHTLKEEKVPEVTEINAQNTFTDISGSQSNKLNQRGHMPEIPIATPVYDTDSLKKLTKIREKSTMNQMFVVTGKTNEYKVTIGELLEIDFDKKMIVNESMGTLRVTRTLHTFDQNKHYTNEFSACQHIYDYFPYEDMEIPVAQPFPAIIKSNHDPEGVGRVQVVFDFEDEVCQHWLKCVTPDGGGNSAIGISQNRGMNFIPEEQDRVIVNFMEGNPDKPYVSGSLFTGSSAKGQGGGKGNHTKYIRDKSGTEVVLNDKDGSIHIKDKNGSDSKIKLDGSKNITIDADVSLTINIGKGQCILKMNKEGKVSIDAKSEIKLCVNETNTLTMTPTNTMLDTQTQIDLKAPTIEAKGSSKILLEKDGSNKLTISGTVVDIDGGQVQIN